MIPCSPIVNIKRNAALFLFFIQGIESDAFCLGLKNKNPADGGVSFDAFCGELGIRTPGSVTFNSFQDCRNRPLCQLSGCEII
jgi:hypothetical protein